MAVPSACCLRCLSRPPPLRPSSALLRLRPHPLRPLRPSRRSYSTLPAPPPPHGVVHLTNRRLLSLTGPDSAHFLNGLISNNVPLASSSTSSPSSEAPGVYTALLNAQGRILHDLFIYNISNHSLSAPSPLPPAPTASGAPLNNEPVFLIDVDARDAERLLNHLKRYKLRAKLTLRLLDVEELSVWAIWRTQPPLTPSDTPTNGPFLTFHDPRAPALGTRVLLRPASNPNPLQPPLTPESPLAAYTLHRLLQGVPEGPRELIREAALPAESNMDLMRGVDYRKGCYVGQELTIRTRHTGVLRKRILPVQLYSSDEDGGGVAEQVDGPVYDPRVGDLAGGLQAGGDIKLVGSGPRGRSVGRWLGGVGNVGLALCRLEAMTGKGAERGRFVVGAGVGDREEGGVGVRAFVPAWHAEREREG
ncbi:MAG: mRNA-decapping enzyme subunit 2 [Vezdaea acicularis]|nr:MAG: mRNA-decapping enzyme subunit 2 [Vezdaea acicularis]